MNPLRLDQEYLTAYKLTSAQVILIIKESLFSCQKSVMGPGNQLEHDNHTSDIYATLLLDILPVQGVNLLMQTRKDAKN